MLPKWLENRIKEGVLENLRVAIQVDFLRGARSLIARLDKFVLVRTDTERAEQVTKILRECGASQVNRHD